MKIALSIGFILILVLVGLGAFWYSSFYSTENKVKNQIAEMQAKGRPVSIYDLKSVTVPNPMNAAIIYEKIFALLPGDTKSDETLFINSNPLSKQQGNIIQWPGVKKAMARYNSFMPLIKTAASKPDCSFLYTWTGSPYQEYRYNSPLRFLNRMICTKAILDSKEGHHKQALHDVEIAFKISESLKREPQVIGQLVRVSMITKSSITLRKIIDSGDFKQADLRHLYDVLSGIDLQTCVTTAVEGETAIGITAYDSFMASVIPKGYHTPSARMDILNRIFIYPDESYFLSYMNICIDTADYSYLDVKSKHLKMPKPPKYHTWSDLLIPIFGGIWKQRDSGIAEIGGSQILLALKAYQLQYGTYPTNLNVLRTKLGWRIPKDPFSRTDFVYKLWDKGFILYSLGQNLRDDGGSPLIHGLYSIPKVAASRTNNDIVWQMEQ